MMVLALAACSAGDDADAGVEDVAGLFEPVDTSVPAPADFPGSVADATAAAGEFVAAQELTVAGAVAAESSGVVDVGAGTATMTVVIHGANRERRLEQRFAAGHMTERPLDRAGARAAEVDASGGGPLLLPESDAVDDAPDLASAVRAALGLVPLHRVEVAGAPEGTTCWAGIVSQARRQRIDVCVDDSNVLRMLRTTTDGSESVIGVATLVLDPVDG